MSSSTHDLPHVERAIDWEPWLGAVVQWLHRPPLGRGALDGIVAGIKDIISVEGSPRGCGAPEVVDSSPRTADATVVRRLREHGVRVVATLETHPLALGVVTPQTRNPCAPGHIAGGSSGGPAAAVAAGLVDIALGTDTGGSVRVPAACCGIAGLKTTRGLVPLTGVQPLAWSLDTVGILARDIALIRETLFAIEGMCPEDPISTALATTRLAEAVDPNRGLRIGVPRQLASMPVSAEIGDRWRRSLERWAAHGATIVECDLPLLGKALTANALISSAEAATVHRSLDEDRRNLLPTDVADRLEQGAQMAATLVAQARWTGQQLAAQTRLALQTVDLLSTPTMPCPVPERGVAEVEIEGKVLPVPRAVNLLTTPWNLVGTTAGTVPVDADSNGLPISTQVIGPWGGEDAVLRAMSELAAESRWI